MRKVIALMLTAGIIGFVGLGCDSKKAEYPAEFKPAPKEKPIGGVGGGPAEGGNGGGVKGKPGDTAD